MFNSTYAVYELNKGIYRKLKKKLNAYAMSTLQYGLHERKTFEIQITKVLGQKCRRLNVCPQVLINWSGTEIGVVTFKNSIPIRGMTCCISIFGVEYRCFHLRNFK